MAKDDPPPQMIPDLQQGKYSDGHPLDDVHYLECKIILKPDRFKRRGLSYLGFRYGKCNTARTAIASRHITV